MAEGRVRGSRRVSDRSGVRALLAVVSVLAALAAIYFGGLINWLACLNEPSEACERQELAEFQWVVAWCGLAPTLVFAYALVTARRRLTLAALVAALAVYIAWAVLADAAHHGWDDLKFFRF